MVRIDLLLFCGIIVSFYPLFRTMSFSPSLNKDSELVIALNSICYLHSLVASVAIIAPTLLDYILDYMTNKDPLLNLHGSIPRGDLILALALPNILIYAMVLPNSYYQILPAISSARELFYLFSVLRYASKYIPLASEYTISKFFLVACFTIANVFESFDPFFEMGTLLVFGTETSPLHLACGVLKLIAFITFLGICASFFKRTKWSSEESNPTYVYMIVMLTFVVGYLIIAFTTSATRWQDLQETYLVSYNFLMSGFTAVLLVLNERHIRSKITETEVDITKPYLKYIST